MYLNRLFVYGTLLPGLDNHTRFIEQHHPQVFNARGKGLMYYLPGDHYPVVVEGDKEIKGVLFEFKNLSVVLPELDEIEKFTGVESQSHLIRVVRDIENLDTGETVKAYMFMWPPERRKVLEAQAQVIPDGDWKRFLQEFNS